MVKALFGLGAILFAATAFSAPWQARTQVAVEPLSVLAFGELVNGSFSSGPSGYEDWSFTDGPGHVHTGSGAASATVRMSGGEGLYVPAGHKEIKLHSDASIYTDAMLGGTLLNVTPVNSTPVTLFYVAEWETLAYPGGVVPEDPWWSDLANRGEVSLSIKVNYENFEPDERSFLFDFFVTPCQYTNRICATNDIIHLKEIPQSVEYSFFLGLGGEGIGVELPGYDYIGRLAIGFGQTLPCPPGTFIGFCQVAIPFEDWNGPGPIWPPVTKVPEPSTWGLMMAGFCVAGLSLRRRERAAA